MIKWWFGLTNSDQIALIGAIATSGGVLLALYSGWRQGKNIEKQFAIQNDQLALQNKQLITQQFSEYTKRYQEIIVNFPENINEASFDFNILDEPIHTRTMRYMRLYFDLCFEEWLLNEKKLIDEVIWFVWKDGIATALSKSAFIQAWSKIKLDTRYGIDFENFVGITIPHINTN